MYYPRYLRYVNVTTRAPDGCSPCGTRHSKSRFNTRNRASTLGIALQHSESRPQHSKSHFRVRSRAPIVPNRAPTLGIALQHSKSRLRIRNRTPIIPNRAPTFEIALQHSKSRLRIRNRAPNVRNRAPTLGIALQHSKAHFRIRKCPSPIVLNWTCRPGGTCRRRAESSNQPMKQDRIGKTEHKQPRIRTASIQIRTRAPKLSMHGTAP